MAVLVCSLIRRVVNNLEHPAVESDSISDATVIIERRCTPVFSVPNIPSTVLWTTFSQSFQITVFNTSDGGFLEMTPLENKSEKVAKLLFQIRNFGFCLKSPYESDQFLRNRIFIDLIETDDAYTKKGLASVLL